MKRTSASLFPEDGKFIYDYYKLIFFKIEHSYQEFGL